MEAKSDTKRKPEIEAKSDIKRKPEIEAKSDIKRKPEIEAKSEIEEIPETGKDGRHKKRRKNKKKWSRKGILAMLLLLLVVLYLILVNVLVSACLVPDFMRKLDKFEEITRKSYAEQVQTSDIKENRSQTLSETAQWYQDVEKRKLAAYTADGYRLIAMEFMQGTETDPAEEELKNTEEASHKWALLLHGYTGWKEEMYEFARWYQEHGYRVIVPDMRCQGESEGDFIGMGYTDARDAQIWLNYMVEQDPEAEIVLHGQSMGAATALMMSDEGLTEEQICKGKPDSSELTKIDVAAVYPHIRAIISDCAYTDAYSMFGEKITDWFHLPPFPLVDSAVLMLKLRGGYDLRKASALEAVQNTEIPILFIHGREDAMISAGMSEELYEACSSSKKELMIVEGAGHAQSQDKDPESYYAKIADFLAE